jgi:citrate synthase
MTAPTGAAITTEIASSDLHHIWIRGHDLTADVMGSMTFADVVFLLIAGRLPDPRDRRLVDAILVSLVEHGLTPSAMVSRVTYTVAPESLQGAVAAGLLGAGAVVLGSMEECGHILTRIDEQVRGGADRDGAVQRIVDEHRLADQKLPGIGHAVHTAGDPRAARLYELAAECGRRGRHLETLERLEAVVAANGTRHPINVTGAVAAILLELGIPWQLHRGFALIARCAGLVAHVGEELAHPITPAIRAALRGAR